MHPRSGSSRLESHNWVRCIRRTRLRDHHSVRNALLHRIAQISAKRYQDASCLVRGALCTFRFIEECEAYSRQREQQSVQRRDTANLACKPYPLSLAWTSPIECRTSLTAMMIKSGTTIGATRFHNCISGPGSHLRWVNYPVPALGPSLVLDNPLHS
jgi:hypothetical protein